jgi:hypothetical protein
VTTHRRYAFQHPGERREGHELVQQVLERACELNWWYQDPEVSGLPYARLAFAFTVSGRDQWWAHHRALKLATDVYYVLGMNEQDVPEPDWEPLAPHTNRGHGRVSVAS